MSSLVLPEGESRRVAPAPAWRQRATRAAKWAWQRPWLALPLLAIPALLPLFALDLPGSHDGLLHLLRLVLLDHHVQQGTLFPRWFPELVGGLGYPVLNFYSPLVYYLAELLHLLGLDFVSAWLLLSALLVLAAGAGMYVFALSVFESRRWPALVVATAYMYAPYLLTNLYVRGAIAELAAQAWLPWVFWSIRRLLTAGRPSQHVLAVALTVGGLAVTHNVTLLFATLALAAYGLILWWHTNRSRTHLAWMALAIVAAMGISAFFWIPLVAERRYLAESAYMTAASQLGEHSWTLRNFLDMSLAFRLSGEPPFQLGLTPAALALAGILVARRRDPEWLFFIALAVLAGIGISAWANPLWLGSMTLLVAQFPWRLLGFMTLPLALLTAGIVLRLRPDAYQAAGAAALIGVIILTNWPRVDTTEVLARAGDRISVSSIPHVEQENALGTSHHREFWPRWSQGTVYEPLAADEPAGHVDLSLSRADAYRLEATVSTPVEQPLRFASLYYPAWRVTLGDGTELPTYPSTNLGLLTVNLPPGSHDLGLRWAGTDLQRAATWISLLSLAGLAIFVWRTNRRPWLAALPFGLLALGLAALFAKPAMASIQTPAQPVTTRSLEMLGYRLEQANASGLYVYPYWYTRQHPSDDTIVRWQLRDETGRVVSEVSARPYFNSQKASNWPAGTLVDDVYLLSLPGSSQEPPNSYQLAVQIAEGDQVMDWVPVGTVAVTNPPTAQPRPVHTLSTRFGDLVELAGFDLRNAGDTLDATASRPPVVRPGDRLEYILYWRALKMLSTNYHGFVHMVDGEGQALVKQDHLAGSLSQVPMLWSSFSLQPDQYLLRIPEDAPPGLYWPVLGLYEFKSMELLPVQDANGRPMDDTYRLPPVKVLGVKPSARPEHRVTARLGNTATLVGYDLVLPATGIRAGSAITLTLQFEAQAPAEADYTRFAHLYSREAGMAAQSDGIPQDGNNPTWAWAPGELVVDQVTLRVAEDAEPGEYSLRVGLYDPTTGVRVPVRDRQGQILPDGQIELAELTLHE